MEFIQHKGLSCVCIVSAFWDSSALIWWLTHGKKMLYVWCFKTSLEVKRRKPLLDSFVLGGNKQDTYCLSKASSVEHKSSSDDSWRTYGFFLGYWMLWLTFFKKLILVSNDDKWVDRESTDWEMWVCPFSECGRAKERHGLCDLAFISPV